MRGELVDSVVADPVAQDRDTRNNATKTKTLNKNNKCKYAYSYFLLKAQREGTEMFISCRCLDGPVSFAICRASHCTVMQMLRNFGPP